MPLDLATVTQADLAPYKGESLFLRRTSGGEVFPVTVSKVTAAPTRNKAPGALRMPFCLFVETSAPIGARTESYVLLDKNQQPILEACGTRIVGDSDTASVALIQFVFN
jgi:hypothetical protein